MTLRVSIPQFKHCWRTRSTHLSSNRSGILSSCLLFSFSQETPFRRLLDFSLITSLHKDLHSFKPSELHPNRNVWNEKGSMRKLLKGNLTLAKLWSGVKFTRCHKNVSLKYIQMSISKTEETFSFTSIDVSNMQPTVRLKLVKLRLTEGGGGVSSFTCTQGIYIDKPQFHPPMYNSLIQPYTQFTFVPIRVSKNWLEICKMFIKGINCSKVGVCQIHVQKFWCKICMISKDFSEQKLS